MIRMKPNTTQSPLNLSIANRLLKLREDNRLTLDQLSTAASELGAPWSRNAIRNMENGQTPCALASLILYSMIFQKLTGQPLRLRDFIGDEGTIVVDGELTIPANSLKEFLSGGILPEPVAVHSETLQSTIKRESAKKTWPEQFTREDDLLEPSLAEDRAGQKITAALEETAFKRTLPISGLTVQAWSRHLYDGKRLADASETRARETPSKTYVNGGKLSPQAIGHATRKITEEILAAIVCQLESDKKES